MPGGGDHPPHGARPCTRDAVALQTVASRLTQPVQQLLQRWQALQQDVCRARHAGDPQRIHHYVLGGAKLARLGVFDEVSVLRHMAKLLLHTARDPALPLWWCKACVEQLAAALSDLQGLLGPRGTRTAAAIGAALRQAGSAHAAPC